MTTNPATASSPRRSTTARAPKAEPKAPISILEACQDEQIFGPWFKDRLTWVAWFAFLKVMFALPLNEAELAIFQQCTGRSAPSPAGYLEATLVIGRRGGKPHVLFRSSPARGRCRQKPWVSASAISAKATGRNRMGSFRFRRPRCAPALSG